MPHRAKLTVGSYNIHKGVGSDYRRDPRRTISVIRELAADIVALQEVDRRFGDRRGVLDLQALNDATGLSPIPLSDRLAELAHGWHGNLILFRNAQFESAHVISLPGLEPRGAIVANLTYRGHRLRVIAAHLGLLKGSRKTQSQRLAEEIGDDSATVMMGDLNEWRQGEGCSLTALKAGLKAEENAQTVPSFPARRPTLSLDRIIGCTAAQITNLRPHDTPLSRLASDHLPIRADIRLGS
ncbi:endonuclease/exonuclease/phosphatase family protein [Pararhodobacter sp.]|uniref:endonuclease/exonuclease/phosphatase family protein n=1 Tax=Pararhodobacter sp. TaxID=2127056 RepID=UPI002AFF4F9B|nr:endonuclease/exonuclease/phosphatase family protein [Pararhodobacter sp.]